MNKSKIKLQGPVITIVMLTFLIMLISSVCSLLDVQGEITKVSNQSLETSVVTVKNIFSKEGMKFLFSSPVETFKNFKPLVVLIITLMSVSIGKASGLFKALFTPLRNLKPAVVTFLTLFIGIISSFLGEYGFILVMPLAAVIYQYLGRNSMLGILTAFIGVSMGYGAGLVFNYDDYQLGLLTKAAAVVDIDKNYIFNAWSNIYAMVSSTIILAVIGTIVIENILKPKVKESIKEEDELNISKKGLAWSMIAFVILSVVFIYMIIPGFPMSGLLLDETKADYVAQLLGDKAPFQDSFAFVFLIITMICSGIYGAISKNIKNTNDFSVGLSKEFDNLGYIFILMFFSALMVSILNWTGLGTVVASWLINIISSLEFTGIPLILTLFAIIVLMSILIPDTLTKWTLASPIIVPVFMKANITPDYTQFIFKVADSVGKTMTPFFIYYIIMLALLEKYNNKETNKITVFGTYNLLKSTILIFTVIWIIITIGWFVMGLPLGPNMKTTL
ncbi:MAG: AbgT family transporter [Bacilli bacterium]|nr:AbgT family transporter [Bacilli bacterium]